MYGKDNGISITLACVCALQLGYTLLDIPEDMEGEEPRGFKLTLGDDEIFSDKKKKSSEMMWRYM